MDVSVRFTEPSSRQSMWADLVDHINAAKHDHPTSTVDEPTPRGSDATNALRIESLGKSLADTLLHARANRREVGRAVGPVVFVVVDGRGWRVSAVFLVAHSKKSAMEVCSLWPLSLSQFPVSRVSATYLGLVARKKFFWSLALSEYERLSMTFL